MKPQSAWKPFIAGIIIPPPPPAKEAIQIILQGEVLITTLEWFKTESNPKEVIPWVLEKPSIKQKNNSLGIGGNESNAVTNPDLAANNGNNLLFHEKRGQKISKKIKTTNKHDFAVSTFNNVEDKRGTTKLTHN